MENYHLSIHIGKKQWLIGYQISLMVIARQPKYHRFYALNFTHKDKQGFLGSKWTKGLNGEKGGVSFLYPLYVKNPPLIIGGLPEGINTKYKTISLDYPASLVVIWHALCNVSTYAYNRDPLFQFHGRLLLIWKTCETWWDLDWPIN